MSSKFGYWKIVPNGSRLVGSPLSPIPQKRQAAFAKILGEPGDESVDLVRRLEVGGDKFRAITTEELMKAVRLHEGGSDEWELVKDYEGTKVERFRNREAFNGAFFLRGSAHLPDVDPEHAVHNIVNIQARAAWDHHVHSCSLWPAILDNDVFYYKLSAAPFHTRDFLCMSVIAKEVDASGFMIYMRQASDELGPTAKESKAVRGQCHITALMILPDDSGGCIFRTISVLEANLSFVPQWVVNIFVPSEFNKWVESLRTRCHQSQAGACEHSQPVFSFFEGSPVSVRRVRRSCQEQQNESPRSVYVFPNDASPTSAGDASKTSIGGDSPTVIDRRTGTEENVIEQTSEKQTDVVGKQNREDAHEQEPETCHEMDETSYGTFCRCGMW